MKVNTKGKRTNVVGEWNEKEKKFVDQDDQEKSGKDKRDYVDSRGIGVTY